MITYFPVAGWVGLHAAVHSSNKSCSLSPFPQCCWSVSSYFLCFSSTTPFLICWCQPDFSLSFPVSCPESYNVIYHNAQEHYSVGCVNVYEKQKSPNSKDMCACMLYAHNRLSPTKSHLFSPHILVTKFCENKLYNSVSFLRQRWTTLFQAFHFCVFFVFIKHISSSYNKSQWDALFLKFILIKNSTCFRQIYCPSPGVSTLYTQQ
jgi:hypothetical protein